jgi:predicted permease
MSTLLRDIRFAIRSLSRAPLFTAVAVLSLALGIGANTSIFSIFDQVLLRLLPVKDPESLVLIATKGAHPGSNRGRNSLSYPMYRDYRDRNDVFSGILCRRGEDVNVSIEGSTERVEAELVSGNYFEVLGVLPAAGRLFSNSDETSPGANPVVVLNYDYWRTRHKADPSIVGKVMRVNNYPMTVVGVAAPGFNGVTLGYRPSVHIPVTMKKQVTPSWDDFENRRTRWVQVLARLKPGITMERAEASIRPLHKQIISGEAQEAEFVVNVPKYVRDQFLRSYAVVLPGGQGDSTMRRHMETPMRVMMGLVGLVLLISCANVSNLLVARATGRQKEISVRLAIGARRARIVGQLLVESMLLSLAGGAFGLLVARWTTHYLLRFAPDEQARLAISPEIDLRILGFTVVLSLAAAFIFGLIPALQVSRTDLARTLKEQSGAAGAGHGGRLRRALVVAQVALSFMLLAGAGLFVQSLQNLKVTDPGFQASNLIRFRLDPTLSGYDVMQTKQFYRQMRVRLSAIPGVTGVGLAVVPILDRADWSSTVTVEGYRSKDGEDMNPHFNSISPGYFKTMGIQVVAGREFDERDGQGARRTGIVNERFAKLYFAGRSPVGFQFGIGGGANAKPDIEIVGVVRDVKYESLNEEPDRQVFVANDQDDWSSSITTYVRTALPSSQMFPQIRREMAQMDPNIPLFGMITMEDQLDVSLSIERFIAFLSSVFGFLATALAIIGLYGVTSFNVTRRAKEIGIRMALGSDRKRVVLMVLKEVLTLSVIGIAIALPLTLWLGKFLQSQLYGVEARDPLTMIAATLGLTAVSVLAGLGPALRASRTDPVNVLRFE